MSRITRILDPSSELSSARFAGTTPSLVGIVMSAAVAFAVPACLTIGDDIANEEARAADQAVPAMPVVWLEDDLLPVAAEIEAAARRHGVDPALLAIVTWVESRGIADARSPIGARGLMQLMPKTAEMIADERGLAHHREDLLDDPDYNLDLGAYHLAELIEDYGGGDELDADTIALAAAAYNGGKNSADAWLHGRPLPEETARYSELVVALWRERELPKSETLAARRR